MPLSVGDRLGPYEIVAPIGAGGMGEVWKARDTRLGRIVAIKQLRGPHSARFEQEARAIAALNHPHICQIYDIGPDFLVLEYIEGKPLSGPRPLEEGIRIAIQITGAMEAAHKRGILHRDLKPANILVAESGAKLLDFGLAKLVTDNGTDATTTIEGTVLGTAAYMSPEQAEGKPLDERSDVFSFGAVLYEMFSGNRAFVGTSQAQVLSSVLRDNPAPLKLARPLARIVTRCLEKQPRDRFQSMGELRASLEGVVAQGPDQQPSIAVLPFANLSRGLDDEYFSDGLSEEIINVLARFPGLKVIARTSAFAFKGQNQDIRRIAETLGVNHILEGSVRRAGDRVRITAQLIDASDGSHLWSGRYDREITDIFAVQDEISEAIAAALQTKLAGSVQRATGDRRPANPEAYQLLLEGQYLIRQVTPLAMDRALECLQRAIELDPGYALPHAALALRAYYQVLYLSVRPCDVIPAALASLARALQLDAQAAFAHAILGMFSGFYQYDWTGAHRHFAQALEFDPGGAFVRGLRACWLLVPTRRLDEALAEITRCATLDPLNPAVRVCEVWLLSMLRKVEVVERARALVKLFPSYSIGRFSAGTIFLHRGLIDEAVTTLEKGLETVPGDVYLLANLALARARQGRRADSEQIRADLEIRAGTQYVPFLPRAYASAACDDIDRTYQLLASAIDEHEPLAALVLADRRDDLLADPGHQTLLHKMNLSP